MDLIKIIIYTTNAGKSLFSDWVENLEMNDRAIIRARIARVRLGNLGDCKQIKGGGGVWELRITHGPGYRIYFGKKGKSIIILLTGGDKGSQNRDITKAKKYWLAYEE